MIKRDAVNDLIIFIRLELALDGGKLFELLLVFCVGVADLKHCGIFSFTNLAIVEGIDDFFADVRSLKAAGPSINES